MQRNGLLLPNFYDQTSMDTNGSTAWMQVAATLKNLQSTMKRYVQNSLAGVMHDAYYIVQCIAPAHEGKQCQQQHFMEAVAELTAKQRLEAQRLRARFDSFELARWSRDSIAPQHHILRFGWLPPSSPPPPESDSESEPDENQENLVPTVLGKHGRDSDDNAPDKVARINNHRAASVRIILGDIPIQQAIDIIDISDDETEENQPPVFDVEEKYKELRIAHSKLRRDLTKLSSTVAALQEVITAK
ncbi:hypothetical protein C8J56DRAFT_1078840 [Mycena floridula]|nr:hypothetical protein C8J56DRAFT_1078840 [Mycena floridula]